MLKVVCESASCLGPFARPPHCVNSDSAAGKTKQPTQHTTVEEPEAAATTTTTTAAAARTIERRASQPAASKAVPVVSWHRLLTKRRSDESDSDQNVRTPRALRRRLTDDHATTGRTTNDMTVDTMRAHRRAAYQNMHDTVVLAKKYSPKLVKGYSAGNISVVDKKSWLEVCDRKHRCVRQ